LTDMEGNASDAFMGLELVEGGLQIAGGRFEESSVVDELTEEALADLDKHFPVLKKIKRPCQWPYENAYDDREGYHYEYATHFPREFEALFRKNVEAGAEDALKDIWENIDKTPYVLFVGTSAIGIFVINNVDAPVIEHMYFDSAEEDAKRIGKEVQERFYRLNADV